MFATLSQAMIPPSQDAQLITGAILGGDVIISEAIDGVASSIDNHANAVSNSFADLTQAITIGLNGINDHAEKQGLFNEYHTTLDKLVQLKERHPQLTINVTPEEVYKKLIRLSPEDRVVLAYIFSQKENSPLFELFKLEVQNGVSTVAGWVNSFFLRAVYVHPLKTKYWVEMETATKHPSVVTGVSIQFSSYTMTLPDPRYAKVFGLISRKNSLGDDVLVNGDVGTASLDNLEKFEYSVWQNYNKDPSILSGLTRIDSFTTQMNTRTLITYFNELYLQAALQVLCA